MTKNKFLSSDETPPSWGALWEWVEWEALFQLVCLAESRGRVSESRVSRRWFLDLPLADRIWLERRLVGVKHRWVFEVEARDLSLL